MAEDVVGGGGGDDDDDDASSGNNGSAAAAAAANGATRGREVAGYATDYFDGARRFNSGGRPNPIIVPMLKVRPSILCPPALRLLLLLLLLP